MLGLFQRNAAHAHSGLKSGDLGGTPVSPAWFPHVQLLHILSVIYYTEQVFCFTDELGKNLLPKQMCAIPSRSH